MSDRANDIMARRSQSSACVLCSAAICHACTISVNRCNWRRSIRRLCVWWSIGWVRIFTSLNIYLAVALVAMCSDYRGTCAEALTAAFVALTLLTAKLYRVTYLCLLDANWPVRQFHGPRPHTASYCSSCPCHRWPSRRPAWFRPCGVSNWWNPKKIWIKTQIKVGTVDWSECGSCHAHVCSFVVSASTRFSRPLFAMPLTTANSITLHKIPRSIGGRLDEGMMPKNRCRIFAVVQPRVRETILRMQWTRAPEIMAHTRAQTHTHICIYKYTHTQARHLSGRNQSIWRHLEKVYCKSEEWIYYTIAASECRTCRYFKWRRRRTIWHCAWMIRW